jgi:two-component system, response regulator
MKVKNKKTLLIEDNPWDVVLTQRALRNSNIANELIVAEDGAEALKFFFGEGEGGGCAEEDLPIVVLLDLKLPKIDGLEVLRRLRSERKSKSIPVAVLTSSNDEKNIVMSYNLGANSYVRKPVKFAEFAEAVKQLGLYLLIQSTAPLEDNVGGDIESADSRRLGAGCRAAA